MKHLSSCSARKSANVMRERKDRMIAAVTMMPEMQSFHMQAAVSRFRKGWGSRTLVLWIQIRYLREGSKNNQHGRDSVLNKPGSPFIHK